MLLSDAIVKVPIPTSFPVGDVNVYVIKGSPLTIVDTGPLSRKALIVLSDSLSSLGYSIQDVEQIILTHSHVDHFGLASIVKNKSGARVYTHPEDRRDVEEFYDEQKRKYREGLSKSGVPRKIIENVANFIRAHAEPVKVDRPLTDGDVVRVDDSVFKVVHTPGHTPGSISLFEESKGVLISGDTLLKEITPNAVSVAKEERGALATYLRTLYKLRDLPVDLVLPGHGDNFTNLKVIVDKYMKHYLGRKSKILRSLSAYPKNAYQIMTDIFGHLVGMNVFLGISEVFGHLEILMNEGYVASYEQRGQIFYKKRKGDGGYSPLNSGFLFSKKAEMPSMVSSADASRPKAWASTFRPTSSGNWAPMLIACFASLSAIGGPSASR